MAIGRPCSSANASAASASATGPSLPGTSGAPTASAIRLASTLSPSRRVASGPGPIQTSPASITACANSALSARNPYPGCTASAPDRRHASSSFSILR
jgi:hypothetical protein